ncbi:pYEATS domain-containing protein [Nitrosomonas communis]|uniref:TIR domain-containing protein n=1 Tax=Nitrosomonas communis TaxID=44574 RepID=A0A1I4QD72_9PROT|nr:pYEATS domain-containing protein [Nitrosomonas communis]SFM37977.1 TIR domain-containing protein [Nitrosomonas communis]
MSIRIEQSSTYAGERRWNWSVWITGSTADLDQIDHVTYTLHPTFPNPVREIHTRKGGFRLESNGWGEFTIYIDIAYKDGKHQQLSHDLRLTSEIDSEDNTEQKGAELTSYMGKVDVTVKHLPPKMIFISGGAADAEVLGRLRESLKKLNLCIKDATDVPAGIPLQTYIDSLIAKADVVIFLISGRPSLWLSQEIESAKHSNKPLIPILVGQDSHLPASLNEYQYFRIDNLNNISDLAHKLLKYL